MRKRYFFLFFVLLGLWACEKTEVPILEEPAKNYPDFMVAGYLPYYSFDRFNLNYLSRLDRIYYFSVTPDEELGLHSEGAQWNFYPTKEHKQELPNVLLIGNSVMNGFKNTVISGLKDKVNIDYWLTPKHLNSEFLFEDLANIVKYRQYKVIQFNIGLHGWPKGRIAEDDYVPLLEKYVTTIQKNAGNSQLIWASITPVT